MLQGRQPLKDHVAAVSCGIVAGQPVLDLDYVEDSGAQTDANFVMTGKGGIVEVQGTAEGEPFTEEQLSRDDGARKGGDRRSRGDAEEDGRRMTHRRLTGKVVIATHNAGKLAEMTELLAPYGVGTVSAAALGLPEPDETGWMFAENAALKAHAAAKAAGLPALADDSGSASTRSTARPVSSRRTGREARAISGRLSPASSASCRGAA